VCVCVCVCARVICNHHFELGLVIVIWGVFLFVHLIQSSTKLMCVGFFSDIALWCGTP